MASLLRGLFDHERLKPAAIRTNHGNVTNSSKLRQVMALGLLEPCDEDNESKPITWTLHLIVWDDISD